ncbi:MAG: riboflavin synthase [Thermodesulfobacteriota bacterium]|nr:riboflavin synthase [Thermodesulfobacteriota bacterium]
MFTGIVESIGDIIGSRPVRGGRELDIDSGLDLSEDKTGDSVAVDGVCLTITAKQGKRFTAFASAETMSRSTISRAAPGSKVNIERALRISDRLGGHLVLGHVDTMAPIVRRGVHGESVRFSFAVESVHSRYVIEKGSIAVDGCSLTVNSINNGVFDVNIIPHTLESISLTGKGPGDMVNLEFDVIGKYVENLLKTDKNHSLEGLLKEQGFI